MMIKHTNHELYLRLKEKSINRGYILIIILSVLVGIDKFMLTFNIVFGRIMLYIIVVIFIIYIIRCIKNIVELEKYRNENNITDEERKIVLDLQWESKKMIGLTLLVAVMIYIYYI